MRAAKAAEEKKRTKRMKTTTMGFLGRGRLLELPTTPAHVCPAFTTVLEFL